MQSTTDKIVEGIVYKKVNKSHRYDSCDGCAGLDNCMCTFLVDSNCSTDYIFKIKDISKQPSVSEQQGVKFDEGKTLYSLVPPYALEAVAKNLTSGLQKYSARNNWMQVEKAEERYLDALYRHLESHRKGEIYDADNIDPTTTHLSAVAVNSLFLLELMLNPKLNKEKKLD